MNALGRFALILIVVLFSVTGSSARDHTVGTAKRAQSTMDLSFYHSRGPFQGNSERSEITPTQQRMLAWIILLMKDGRGAR
jgi:hypothetical protein